MKKSIRNEPGMSNEFIALDAQHAESAYAKLTHEDLFELDNWLDMVSSKRDDIDMQDDFELEMVVQEVE